MCMCMSSMCVWSGGEGGLYIAMYIHVYVYEIIASRFHFVNQCVDILTINGEMACSLYVFVCGCTHACSLVHMHRL